MKKFFLILTVVATVKCTAKTGHLIPVYRWYILAENQYCTVAEGEFSDEQLIKNGWVEKTFLFYAYTKPDSCTVAIYAWFNPKTHAHISIAGDEFTDDQMIKNGYEQKRLQFYALACREAGAVPVYRWLLPGRHSWITSPEGSDSTLLAMNGYCHRTYQYFGIMKP